MHLHPDICIHKKIIFPQNTFWFFPVKGYKAIAVVKSCAEKSGNNCGTEEGLSFVAKCSAHWLREDTETSMDCQKVCVGDAEHKSSATSFSRFSKIIQQTPVSKRLAASKMTGTELTTQNNTDRRKITFISRCESTLHLADTSREMLAVPILSIPLRNALQANGQV